MNLDYLEMLDLLKEIKDEIDVRTSYIVTQPDKILHGPGCENFIDPYQAKKETHLSLKDFLENPEPHLHEACHSDMLEGFTVEVARGATGKIWGYNSFLLESQLLLTDGDLTKTSSDRSFQENINCIRKLDGYRPSILFLTPKNYKKRNYPAGARAAWALRTEIIKHLVDNNFNEVLDYLVDHFNSREDGSPKEISLKMYQLAIATGKEEEISELIKKRRDEKKADSRFLLAEKGPSIKTKKVLDVRWNEENHLADLLSYSIDKLNPAAKNFWQMPVAYLEAMEAMGCIYPKENVIVEKALTSEEAATLDAALSKRNMTFLKTYKMTLG